MRKQSGVAGEVFSAASGVEAVEGEWRAAEFAAGEAADWALEADCHGLGVNVDDRAAEPFEVAPSRTMVHAHEVADDELGEGSIDCMLWVMMFAGSWRREGGSPRSLAAVLRSRHAERIADSADGARL